MRGQKDTEIYVVLTPKNDAAKKKMDYHGNRWILRRELETVKFSMERGPWLVIVSRDGKKLMHVKKENDPEFDVRRV